MHANVMRIRFANVIYKGSAEAGEIETLAHEASGTVHILDSRTIYLENFNYDGQGPGISKFILT